MLSQQHLAQRAPRGSALHREGFRRLTVTQLHSEDSDGSDPEDDAKSKKRELPLETRDFISEMADNFDVQPAHAAESAMLMALSQTDRVSHEAEKRRHRALFWFSSPRLFDILTQALVFLNSFYLALYAIFTSIEGSRALHGAGAFIAVIPALFVFPVLALSLIPRSSLVTHTEYLYKADLIAAVMEKMEVRKDLEEFAMRLNEADRSSFVSSKNHD